MITEPTVSVWAKSSIDIEMYRTFMDSSGDDSPVLDSDLLAEAAGRACYASFHRPNPKTATTETYIQNILELQHHSVLAHGSVTFYIEGVSRSLTHELIRSRFLAFSQLSQRYVDSSEMDWVCPPQYLSDLISQEILSEMWNDALTRYDTLVKGTLVGGASRKRARESARAVLPNMCETKIVVTGNHRAWRDFIAQRNTLAADLEIHRLAGILLEKLTDLAPATYSDML
jgi:thymidylate synthase (FAD)